MTKHTEGPWTIPAPWSGFSEIRGPNGEFIFGLAAGSEDVKQSDETCEANALLIKAAPTMLAALKALLASHDASCPGEECQLSGVDLARAAISLACGSSTKDIEG